uniref:Transmembrane protein n=1 Tax=Heterorhabditis bacteriophora TaxID=37862 RepID=A0A1I7WXF1_HETBA
MNKYQFVLYIFVSTKSNENGKHYSTPVYWGVSRAMYQNTYHGVLFPIYKIYLFIVIVVIHIIFFKLWKNIYSRIPLFILLFLTFGKELMCKLLSITIEHVNCYFVSNIGYKLSSVFYICSYLLSYFELSVELNFQQPETCSRIHSGKYCCSVDASDLSENILVLNCFGNLYFDVNSLSSQGINISSPQKIIPQNSRESLLSPRSRNLSIYEPLEKHVNSLLFLTFFFSLSLFFQRNYVSVVFNVLVQPNFSLLSFNILCVIKKLIIIRLV